MILAYRRNNFFPSCILAGSPIRVSSLFSVGVGSLSKRVTTLTISVATFGRIDAWCRASICHCWRLFRADYYRDQMQAASPG